MGKLAFLRNDFLDILAALPANTKQQFGKMNVHQMIEHMAWAFRIASGKLFLESNQSPEVTEKMYGFMMSDKPFRDNTPNAHLGDTPMPLATAHKMEAIELLKLEIDHFVSVYETQPDLRIENPFFGELNFEEQTHLLHKHAMHHLRQFDAQPT